MKISISTYSFGTYAKTLGLKGIIDKAKEFGADGIDFALSSIDGETYAEKLANCKKMGDYVKKIGLQAFCCCWHLDFVNCENKDQEVKKGCEYVDFTIAYGADKMRIDVVGPYPNSRKVLRDYDTAVAENKDYIRKVVDYAAAKGIVTMTENHGFFSQDADRVEKMINAVASENFGALVDIGNFMCADEDPAVSVGKLAPYARYVHVKDFYFKSGRLDNPGEGWFSTRAGNYLKGAIIGHGDVPVKQCLTILKKAGYDGAVGLEFEGMEDKLDGIRIGIANLKRFMD